jgi:hypothetical protein
MRDQDRSCCVLCREFRFYNGDYGYSEYTPGNEAEMYCAKRHWRVDLFETTQKEYRDMMLLSKTCEDFKKWDT